MSVPLRYPRPATLAALGPGHNVVESSAGTGKTFLLEHLFVDLILTHGVAAEEILVVTFTEKATAELQLRLRRLLGDLAALTSEHEQARAATGLPPAQTWTIDDGARATLSQALLGFDRIVVSTIHGFCQRVLRDHAFGQGRLFDEAVVDRETVWEEAFRETLRTEVAADAGLGALVGAYLEAGKSVAGLGELLGSCNQAHAEALRPAWDEARLAAALAAWQPDQPPDAEIRARLKAAGVHGNTINATLRHRSALSKVVGESAGDLPRFLVALHAKKGPKVSDLLANLDRQPGDTALTALAGRVRALKAAGVPLEAALAQRLTAAVAAAAARRKRGAGLVDFDDMIGLLERALDGATPAGRALCAALRQRFRHALIDEFQDTDPTQWTIFRRVFVEADQRHGLTVIGDPKQAIYGFRGANVETYLEARADLEGGGARRVDLDRNFRSTKKMIEATNLIFDQRAGFFRPGGRILYDHPVASGRPERHLVAESGGAAAPVVLFGLETSADWLGAPAARTAVARAIVAELVRLRAGAGLRASDAGQGPWPRLGSVFILTFSNRESQTIGRALGEAGIPHAFYKQGNLFATPEARELLDVLRAICAPADRGLRARALHTRCFGLDLPEIARCLDAGSGPSALLARWAARAATGDVPGLFSALLEDSGVGRRELFAGAGERGLTNVLHVLELLQAEWARTHASLPRLVLLLDRYVRGAGAPPGRDSDLQRLHTDEDAVQILTVHKAKGLEADVVFVFGGTFHNDKSAVRVVHEHGRRLAYVGKLEDDLQSRFDTEQADEDSRLLYVALTRARYRMYLPHYPPAFERLDGAYARLNRRLDEIARTPAGDGFERRRVDCETTAEVSPAPGAVAGAAIDPVWLASPREPAEVAAIRRARKGFLVTSYSAVKRAREGLHPVEEAAGRQYPGEHHAATLRVPDALPGGAATGVFLHDLLERVALGGLAPRPDFAAWFAEPEVARLLERRRRLHGRPAAELEPAARLVHAAYTTPVRTGPLDVEGLARVATPLREMEFHYPMPEPDHALLAGGAPAEGGRPWRIERGVVKGFVDLFFAHAGRVYVLDWKSDLLADYDPETLTRHAGQHYEVQARLYTLAALRLCGIGDRRAFAERFGSVIFYFLRGRGGGDPATGVHARTPDWDEILAWEREMLAAPFWGLGR